LFALPYRWKKILWKSEDWMKFFGAFTKLLNSGLSVVG
jgi:hypothetical protein